MSYERDMDEALNKALGVYTDAESTTDNHSGTSCAACGFDIKHPAIPFDCADGKTYCASCFVDRSVIGPMMKSGTQKSTSDTWFAWFPVRLGALGTGRWAWLQNVWRNKCCGVAIYQSLDV